MGKQIIITMTGPFDQLDESEKRQLKSALHRAASERGFQRESSRSVVLDETNGADFTLAVSIAKYRAESMDTQTADWLYGALKKSFEQLINAALRLPYKTSDRYAVH